MSTPSIITAWEDKDCIFRLRDLWHQRHAITPLFLPGTWAYSTQYRSYTGDAAVRIDGVWKVERIRVYGGGTRFGNDNAIVSCQTHSTSQYRELASGLDPRVTQEDVEGAAGIYLNDDDDGWLFFHTKAGAHHDHELALAAAIEAVFQPVFRQYQVDQLTGKTTEAKNRAQERFVLLSAFYGEVLAQARTIARNAHLGERHKDPHPETGHVSAELAQAFAVVKTKWEADRVADMTKLGPAMIYVQGVIRPHSPETRWERAARIAAEAKKKAAEAENGEEA